MPNERMIEHRGQHEQDRRVREAERGRRDEHALQLIELARDAELFHNADGEAYATIPVGEHRENWRVRSRQFEQWLIGRYYRETNDVPPTESVQKALRVIEARAIHDGPEYHVAVRIAEYAGNIYLDLADRDWRVVEIAPSGWSVIADAPVPFRRPHGLRPLPLPVNGGDLNSLQRFLNLDGEDDWHLLFSWLVAAYWPRGPYPVLVLHGEHGTAKSTTARVLRGLIDPNVADLRSEPREVRDLMIAAHNSHVLAFDNLSQIKPALSDALCRLATGGGFGTRRLYEDLDEVLIQAQRPIILNGIEDLATRSDLLDRSLIIDLMPIDESERRAESDFWGQYEEARPRLLGAMLDVLVGVLRELPSVEFDYAPRMADFARLGVAVERVLGWPAGSFLGAYEANRTLANEIALESCPILPLIQEIGTFAGTHEELLAELKRLACNDEIYLPRTPRALGGLMRRIAPNLRRDGFVINFRRAGGRRLVEFWRRERKDAGTGQNDNGTCAVGDAEQTYGFDDANPELQIPF